ncbi:hypothetical protein GCM10011581_48640 [Saccharopolyspora subtropica]|uniref:Uncharacterized protein n=1 Tax=Saccharopolyspora thermophila TaxID=89367 RepID=A0A917K9K2_9PSEU|nr:hypothetical protein GCM10011581_48640 [Saccharopolyspora subtropica]
MPRPEPIPKAATGPATDAGTRVVLLRTGPRWGGHRVLTFGRLPWTAGVA